MEGLHRDPHPASFPPLSFFRGTSYSPAFFFVTLHSVFSGPNTFTHFNFVIASQPADGLASADRSPAHIPAPFFLPHHHGVFTFHTGAGSYSFFSLSVFPLKAASG